MEMLLCTVTLPVMKNRSAAYTADRHFSSVRTSGYAGSSKYVILRQTDTNIIFRSEHPAYICRLPFLFLSFPVWAVRSGTGHS